MCVCVCVCVCVCARARLCCIEQLCRTVDESDSFDRRTGWMISFTCTNRSDHLEHAKLCKRVSLGAHICEISLIDCHVQMHWRYRSSDRYKFKLFILNDMLLSLGRLWHQDTTHTDSFRFPIALLNLACCIMVHGRSM